MKILSFSLATLFLFSCSKENMNNKPQVSPTFNLSQAIWDFIVPADLNTEGLRIVTDVQEPDYEIGLIDNANAGQFSSTPGNDIVLGGITPSNITLKLNGDLYSPNANGNFHESGLVLKNYFGKNVTIEISDGTTTKSKTIFVPDHVLANPMLSGSQQKLDRVGSNLTWTPALNNPSGKVAFIYYLYDAEDFETEMYNGDMLIIDDNGTYNLDNILSDTQCKKIAIRLISGNTFSETINDKKYLVYISTYDHHEYLVE